MFSINTHEPIPGPYTVEGEFVLRGSIAGDATVPAGACLELPGRVDGRLIVQAGGRAMVYGQCSAGLVNDGEADVYGVVHGGIAGTGLTRVSGDALVDGVRGRDLNYPPTPLTNEEANKCGVTVNMEDTGEVVVVGERVIENHVVVEGEMEIRGAATAGVRVLRDGWFILSGAILGGLVVEEGGHAVIKGWCNGGISNQGDADVFGVVTGGITGSGATRVAPDAVIDGVRGHDLGWAPVTPTS